MRSIHRRERYNCLRLPDREIRFCWRGRRGHKKRSGLCVRGWQSGKNYRVDVSVRKKLTLLKTRLIARIAIDATKN